ncbi:transcriptional repressor LexA [Roseiterribacter gracilis]|uniref:LexA repressor n=1 Tax=Roseiterribacter gracilis TaxID=2812848 RepID=A0A8S8X8Y0_9PROT|nr:LexA repressor [Rhodospirillales bacterium TMPK1]
MLTRKQHELLMLIHERVAAEGVAPSFDEMKDALGLKSKSGIHRLITALEERGFLRRLAHRARALEVVRLPEGTRSGTPLMPPRPAARSNVAPFRPSVIKGDFSAVLSGRPVERLTGDLERAAVNLPLYGKIAAGTPIEALRDQGTSVEVPPDMVGSGDFYALKVAGDSMQDEGILDGDTVVIQRCETAETGQIVVALIDDQEATLKRFRKKGNTIALEPANAAHKVQIFGAERVKVQGRLVGLIRKY